MLRRRGATVWVVISLAVALLRWLICSFIGLDVELIRLDSRCHNLAALLLVRHSTAARCRAASQDGGQSQHPGLRQYFRNVSFRTRPSAAVSYPSQFLWKRLNVICHGLSFLMAFHGGIWADGEARVWRRQGKKEPRYGGRTVMEHLLSSWDGQECVWAIST